jgi:rubrerythrin
MASKRRVRSKSCEGKVRHESMDAAWTAARKTGEKIRPYRCRWCGKLHAGHEPGKQKRRRTVHA